MYKNLRTLFVAAILLSSISVQLLAQVTSSIHGRVTDETGATVPNAQITVINTETNLTRAVTSSAQGEYLADFLPVGSS